MTKQTTILYSKHIILNIPGLFELSVAEFMYSFDNAELAKHNYFSDNASVHQYQTRLALLQKYHLPNMKTFLG